MPTFLQIVRQKPAQSLYFQLIYKQNWKRINYFWLENHFGLILYIWMITLYEYAKCFWKQIIHTNDKEAQDRLAHCLGERINWFKKNDVSLQNHLVNCAQRDTRCWQQSFSKDTITYLVNIMGVALAGDLITALGYEILVGKRGETAGSSVISIEFVDC